MSSGFVSGGTVDAPIERDDEWLAAQKELEDLRRKRAEESRQNDGRSLFEILEANKAAKQEAFEEANKLKNQFRSLDEDEIEFLDSVMESTRNEEEKVKKETKERLEAFRRQQELADKRLSGDAGSGEAVEEQWTAGPRKRRRARDKEGLRGVKLRKLSTDESEPAAAASSSKSENMASESQSPTKTSPSTGKALTTSAVSEGKEVALETKPEAKAEAPKKPAPIGKGLLVDYGSDEDDD